MIIWSGQNFGINSPAAARMVQAADARRVQAAVDEAIRQFENERTVQRYQAVAEERICRRWNSPD